MRPACQQRQHLQRDRQLEEHPAAAQPRGQPGWGPARLPHRTAPHRPAPAAAQRRGAAACRALSSAAVLKPQEPLRQNSAPLSPSPRARGNGGGRPAARPAGGGDGGGMRRRSMRGPQRARGAAAAVSGRPCPLPARG